jgi:hypothetical protein
LLVIAALFATLTASHAASAQKTKPTLDEILQRLQENLEQYDARVPSFFCDEHLVSRVIPDLHDRQTVTDSVFRIKRVLNADHTTTLEDSRDVKSIDGKLATSQQIDVPTMLDGAFEGGLAVVSVNQQSCMNYTLERSKRKAPDAPYVIHFATVLTPQNTAGCLLQEKGKGQVYIDPATMQITRLELITPHHTIDPGDAFNSPSVGDRVLSVDYAPVLLEGQSFWMPSTIASTVTRGRGTYHVTVWSFKASYRNFHKLEVTSRMMPFDGTIAK